MEFEEEDLVEVVEVQKENPSRTRGSIPALGIAIGVAIFFILLSIVFAAIAIKKGKKVSDPK